MLQFLRYARRGTQETLHRLPVLRQARSSQQARTLGSAFGLETRRGRNNDLLSLSEDGGRLRRQFSRSAVALLDTQKLREEWGTPSFDVPKMMDLLDHDNHEKRNKFRKFVAEDPFFKPKYNISLDEERDLALARLKKLCDQDLISVLDFRRNPQWVFAAHELGAIVDPAMTTKMTVQFNLFGGTVLKLGTERHHDKLLKVSHTCHETKRQPIVSATSSSPMSINDFANF